MTNAEKLAKDTERLSEIITDSKEFGCRQCVVYGLGVCNMCHSHKKIKEWLEMEANEDE